MPGWQTFYVSRDDAGKLYMKNGKNLTAEENEYVVTVSAQDDVVEFNNRVSVEFNDLLSQNPEIGAYMSEFGSQVQAASHWRSRMFLNRRLRKGTKGRIRRRAMRARKARNRRRRSSPLCRVVLSTLLLLPLSMSEAPTASRPISWAR